MLQALSPMVSVALTRAHEARDMAAAASNGTDRRFWREMERRWMRLARSYEMSERLDAFVLHRTGRC